MYHIKLPKLDWFLNRNVFTGSFRADLTKGCMAQTTFCYRVRLINLKGELVLSAVCYYQLPWNGITNMHEAFTGFFAASEFGLDVCATWIQSKFMQNMTTPITPPNGGLICTGNGTLTYV